MAKIRIPAALRAHVHEQIYVEVPSGTVRQALDYLIQEYPALTAYLTDSGGSLPAHVNLFLRGHQLEDVTVQLNPGDELYIATAMAGG